ncbi:MAG TPA: hypothetical protein VGW40_03010 [Allosphingosinicella sp.]|nr:hypothetical protein [Allosphingosinicella sp.]
MTKTSVFLALLGGTSLAAAALAQPGQSGGTATYWMSAETASGMAAMAGMSGAGQPPSRGSIIGGLLTGRGPSRPSASNPGYVHNLRLDLGSPRRPAGAPAADHFIPAGLNAGPSLPLVSPEPGGAIVRPSPTPGQGDGAVNGRILIYWGCGEHARPGQPYEIDLARLGAGQVPPAMAALALRPMQPPSQANSATFGEWPNPRSRTTIPASGSLVGAHSIRGNYSPDINFTLAPGQDFLAPIVLTANTRARSGAGPLAWNPVANAQGYLLMAFGSAENNTMVMWSSSEVQFSQMGAFDYLAPEEAARLVRQRVLLDPATTQCTVPAEVAGRVQAASLMMTAFGPEANFSYPARPARAPRGWAPDWTVKLRTRSAYMGLLGQDMEAMMRGESQPQQEQPRRRRNPLGRIFGQ